MFFVVNCEVTGIKLELEEPRFQSGGCGSCSSMSELQGGLAGPRAHLATPAVLLNPVSLDNGNWQPHSRNRSRIGEIEKHS